MKKVIVFCLSVFVTGAVSGQPSDKFTGSLLWRISGGGLTSPSYIFGTHHLASVDTFDGIAGARQALEGSSQVVGEIVLADIMAIGMQMQLAALMPENVSYRSLLSASDYEALDNTLKGLFGVGMEQFGMVKPGAISTTLTQAVFAKAYPDFNMASHVALDSFVQNFANEKGLPVLGLETMEDQIRVLFDAEPLKVQAERLACSARNIDYATMELQRLHSNYMAADLVKMYTDSLEDPDNPCPVSGAFQNALVKERNDKWLAKLPAIMAGAPSFIAVGALHLAGQEGLLFQLDGMGYTVEAVK